MSAGVIAASYVAESTAHIATITIASGTVASNLTDFVTRVDLGDLPTEWWDAGASDGSEVRVKSGGSVIPTHLTHYAPAFRVGEVYFKATLNSGSDNVFTVEQVSGASALDPTDPNGRDAVWSDYDFAWIASAGLINCNGGASLTTTGTQGLLAPLTRSPDVFAHQGIAYDAGTDCFIIIDTDELVRYDRSWVEQARETTPLADTGISGVIHMGDGCVVNGELFVCVDDYPSTTIQHVAVFDAATLAFDRSYDVVSVGFQIASICWDGTYFYTVGYSAGTNVNTSIQKWNSDWTHNSTITTATLTTKQGIEIQDGYFWISRGSVNPFEIYRVDLDGSNATLAWNSNWTTATNGECEGITSDGQDLYHLFDNTAGTSRVFQMVDSDDPRAGRGFGTGGYLKLAGLPKRASWTMGATGLVGRTLTANTTFISYGTNDTSDSNRATLVARESSSPDQYGIWNSTDTWLMDTSVSVSAWDTPMRCVHTQNGTTDRKIYRNGAHQATDSGVAQRPASTGDTIFVGTDDTSNDSPWYGWLNRAYLRNGELSADWLAAEYASWEDTSNFYTVS